MFSGDRPLRRDLDVLEEQDALLDARELRERIEHAIDHDAARQPAHHLPLSEFVAMRVVPVESAVVRGRKRDLVLQLLARLDEHEDVVGNRRVGIDPRRHVQAVVVDVRGLVRLVVEFEEKRVPR